MAKKRILFRKKNIRPTKIVTPMVLSFPVRRFYILLALSSALFFVVGIITFPRSEMAFYNELRGISIFSGVMCVFFILWIIFDVLIIHPLLNALKQSRRMRKILNRLKSTNQEPLSPQTLDLKRKSIREMHKHSGIRSLQTASSGSIMDTDPPSSNRETGGHRCIPLKEYDNIYSKPSCYSNRSSTRK